MDLFEVVSSFRRAMEECDRSKWPASFSRFPLGSCGDTCIVLGECLFELGFGKFEYVSGWRHGKSHAWLEQNKLIVDITADQFSDAKPVIVTRDQSWHKQFNVDSRHECVLSNYDEHTKAELSPVLEKIKQQMKVKG